MMILATLNVLKISLENIRYNYTSRLWMYYDGRRWKNDDTGRMKILTDKVAESIKKKTIQK